MKCIFCWIFFLAFFSGCILPAPSVPPAPADALADILTTYATTTYSTTTTRPHVELLNPNDIFQTTTSTSTTSYTFKTTSSTSSTSTTVTIPLKRREYMYYHNNSFYLRDVEIVGGVPIYELTYTSSDGLWDTIKFSDRFFLDDLEIGLADVSTPLTPKIYVKRNDYVNFSADYSRVFTFGGGLSERMLSNYQIVLGAPLGGKLQIRLTQGGDTTYMELMEGDVGYFKSLEFGVLDARLKGGYSMIYALDDGELYRLRRGSRRCDTHYKSFKEAETVFVSDWLGGDAYGINVSVNSFKPPYVNLNFTYDGGFKTVNLSCGEGTWVKEKKVDVVWYGGKELSTKLIFHS